MARRRFQFDEQQRKFVKSLAGMAVRQDHICNLVGVRSQKTLRKHFRTELDYGFAQTCAAVARTAYEMATSGRYPQMSMFGINAKRSWCQRSAKSRTTRSRERALAVAD